MQLTKCSRENLMTGALRKIAVRQAIAEIKIDKTASWEVEREKIAVELKKLAEINPIGQEEIMQLLKQASAEGIKFGDGSEEDLLKEAGWWDNMVGGLGGAAKGLGQGMQNMGQGIGSAVQKGIEGVKNIGQGIANIPQNIQNWGTEVQQNAAISGALKAAQDLKSNYAKLKQLVPDHPVFKQTRTLGDFIKHLESGNVKPAPAPAGQAPAGQPAAAGQAAPAGGVNAPATGQVPANAPAASMQRDNPLTLKRQKPKARPRSPQDAAAWGRQ